MANHRGTRWRGKIPIPPHAHPIVRRLIQEANRQHTTLSEIAQRSGVNVAAIGDWRYRRMPRLDNLEAALNALDLELVIRVRHHQDAEAAE